MNRALPSCRIPAAPLYWARSVHWASTLGRRVLRAHEGGQRQIPHGESRGLVQASLHLTSLSPAQGYDTSECIGTHAWHLSVWRCGQRLNRRTGFEPVPLPSETAGYLWRGEPYPRKRRIPERDMTHGLCRRRREAAAGSVPPGTGASAASPREGSGLATLPVHPDPPAAG